MAFSKAEALIELHKIIKPGDSLKTILRHVSRSGLSRSISIVLPSEMRVIDYLVAPAIGNKIDSCHGGIKIGGCGMDMGFSLCYDLSSEMWPHGTEKPHGTRNGEPDSSGGYALKQSWL